MTDTLSTVSTWTIDPSHSQVEFTVKHMMFSKVKGSFTSFNGTIDLDEQNIENSTVRVEIDPATINTRDEKRDAHLRSADFFNTDVNPMMTFVSTKVERDGDEDLKITGDLTMNGVTKSVVLEAELEGRGMSPFGMEVLGYSAETKISRKDFDINWNAALETGGVLVSDEVTIKMEIQAVPTTQE
ncbi:MAG TPA: YceI family protein [Thermomicrobiales bacterium]|nr:YceI family protein [Thermomicrobiales bacterium]